MKLEPRIAFVIDALPSLGGAEKVLFTALEIFPQADVFTLVYNRQVFKNTPLGKRTVKTSFIDHLPFSHRQHRLFLPLMPYAIERFDLQDYETIISFSYAVAHGVRRFNDAHHVSYTFTPMRYAWMDLHVDGTHKPKNILMDRGMSAFRKWDKKAAEQVNLFVAVSQAVSSRIEAAYHRDSEIIYPPVEVNRFAPSPERENYFITVSRLVPHKRLDLLVVAFSQLNLPLLIVGDGPELKHLAHIAKPNIKFLGYLPDRELAELLGKAKGFISVTEEDFGIAMVEAQAAGCPVIAFGKGGALEIVIDKETGLFFSEQTVESLIEALLKFDRIHSCFHGQHLVQNARRFRKEIFASQFKQLIPGSG